MFSVWLLTGEGKDDHTEQGDVSTMFITTDYVGMFV